MPCNRYQGGTVAAATPQRAGEMRLCRQLFAASAKRWPIVRAGLAFSEKPIHRRPSKNEIKYQNHEK
jgi:hypothetical protein